LLVVVLLLSCGVFGAVSFIAGDYAFDKTARFFLLTWTAALAVALLVREQYDSKRFLRAVIVVALGLSVFIAFAGEQEYDSTFGRLTTSGGDTILFGQACGAVVVTTAAWLLTSRRVTLSKLVLAAALVGFEIWTMLAIASKGPVQALIISAAAIIIVQFRRLSPNASMRIVGIVTVLILALVAVWPRVPLWSRERILEFASGRSAGARLTAWRFTWSNLDASPFGRGWGSWNEDSPIEIGHPHNLFLEVWYEAGLLGLAAVLLALVIVLLRILAVYRVDIGAATLTLGLVVFWLASAQVSSDVNGNKLLFGVLVAAAAPIVHQRLRPEVVGPTEATTGAWAGEGPPADHRTLGSEVPAD
jgi:O-antigen ligase